MYDKPIDRTIADRQSERLYGRQIDCTIANRQTNKKTERSYDRLYDKQSPGSELRGDDVPAPTV